MPDTIANAPEAIGTATSTIAKNMSIIIEGFQMLLNCPKRLGYICGLGFIATCACSVLTLPVSLA